MGLTGSGVKLIGAFFLTPRGAERVFVDLLRLEGHARLHRRSAGGGAEAPPPFFFFGLACAPVVMDDHESE